MRQHIPLPDILSNQDRVRHRTVFYSHYAHGGRRRPDLRRLLRSVAKGETIDQDTSTVENSAVLAQFADAV